MKRIKLRSIAYIIFAIQISISANSKGQNIPYSTDSEFLTIWNGTQYVPFFIKGTNLGVSVPGTFPGELAATRNDYSKWFTQIKDAGFNCIRIYTLHYPRFYEVLDSFNLANKHNPLLFIQGVWLNESFENYNYDLFSIRDTFRTEIAENIDCIHGNRFIPERRGKAYGYYTKDASKWCLAYIIGREIYPNEILTTNHNNSDSASFSGKHFSIQQASGSEVWITSNLDYLVNYEQTKYQTQRPVSISSWPTLDPLPHPEEVNRDEDTASVDLSKIIINDAPAGLFISYHAYPYYPDFISQQSNYTNDTDEYGKNSYKGYLSELKSHYPNFPLIIAEYGVPSSWGIAHYASSGMNHGGFDEYNQGLTNMRLLNTIEETGCGGGINFSWIDEWFKRTWITDPLDFIAESRVLWHNIAAAEQNFGLVSFKSQSAPQTIAQLDTNAEIQEIKASANTSFFELEIVLKNPLNISNELWIALDTYSDSLGESILPNEVNIPFRSEFALNINNYSANVYVTEAYDTYGIWHNTAGIEQQFKSTVSNGAPWYIVRWKNNSGDSDIQYIGSLQVNYSFQNPSSKDGVTIYDDKIKVRIPWSLINFVAPDHLWVLHDDRSTSDREFTTSEGINVGVLYQQQWYASNQRFNWTPWNATHLTSIKDTFKTSYFVTKDNLMLYNSPAIAVSDSFNFNNDTYPITVNTNNGLLKNDFDLDGDDLIALIIDDPKNGEISLNNDGSFIYYPHSNFNGTDTLIYCLYDGYDLSTPNYAIFSVQNNTGFNESSTLYGDVSVYPNPFNTNIVIRASEPISQIKVFDVNGKYLFKSNCNQNSCNIDLSDLISGTYLLVVKIQSTYHSIKIIKI